ncbi:1-acyl-sn-glycerol-3-phosphate acyltransferase [Ligilactobacillus salitolerans]|uniref:1-acyl-sn-glycerol-3-phosphate acyltransferase n=1 Tax=Ligilactobacillus salitolerans TaxID=1808352 RepID=A0A401IU74_9LACO|nr:1-acyl-sn-glycerol-3-phosphate acyltransferase [Ligilactobacillus salitolerans]GBG95079.1 1-acyl-sn-glycerol-3-phosphate acyltransferase [Ligilactobacillus salitolerans]
MFYTFIRVVARVIVFLINGHSIYLNKEKLPKGNYILVGPHRTWFDMIYFALAAAPKPFSFMAKEELFKNPVLRFILKHANAFPVDRAHPGPSAIKTPVRWLRQRDISLIMFPSGTRHSQEMKGGVTLIAKLAGVPIVPAVYQGPLTFKQLFSRKAVTIAFGEPITVDRKTKMTDEYQTSLLDQMEQQFQQLDQQIDPNFKYIDVSGKKENNSSQK